MPNPQSRSMECAKQVVDTVPMLMRLIRSSVRASGTSLSLSQVRVLGFVARTPGASVSEVAAHLDVTIPSASALVDRLVKRHFVKRVDDPNERRRVLLTITESGSSVLDESRSRAQSMMAHLLSVETPENINTISEGLTLLAGAAQSFNGNDSKTQA